MKLGTFSQQINDINLNPAPTLSASPEEDTVKLTLWMFSVNRPLHADSKVL